MISFTDYLSYGKNSVLNSSKKYKYYTYRDRDELYSFIFDMITFKNELVDKGVDITLLPDYIQHCDKSEFIFPDTNFIIPLSDLIKFDARNGEVEIKDGQINFSISLPESVEVEDIYGFKRVVKLQCYQSTDITMTYGYFNNIFEVNYSPSIFLLNKAIYNHLEHSDKDIKSKYSIYFRRYNFRILKEKFYNFRHLYVWLDNIEDFIKIINHRSIFNEIIKGNDSICNKIIEERVIKSNNDSIENLLNEIQHSIDIKKSKESKIEK